MYDPTGAKPITDYKFIRSVISRRISSHLKSNKILFESLPSWITIVEDIQLRIKRFLYFLFWLCQGFRQRSTHLASRYSTNVSHWSGAGKILTLPYFMFEKKLNFVPFWAIKLNWWFQGRRALILRLGWQEGIVSTIECLEFQILLRHFGSF